MIANRDNLIVAGADDAAGLEAMLKMAAEALQQLRPISSIAVRFDGEEWVPWLPEAVASFAQAVPPLLLRRPGTRLCRAKRAARPAARQDEQEHLRRHLQRRAGPAGQALELRRLDGERRIVVAANRHGRIRRHGRRADDGPLVQGLGRSRPPARTTGYLSAPFPRTRIPLGRATGRNGKCVLGAAVGWADETSPTMTRRFTEHRHSATLRRDMFTKVQLPKAFSVRDEHEFYPMQHLMARLNPDLMVKQVATGVHVEGGGTVFWGIVYRARIRRTGSRSRMPCGRPASTSSGTTGCAVNGLDRGSDAGLARDDRTDGPIKSDRKLATAQACFRRLLLDGHDHQAVAVGEVDHFGPVQEDGPAGLDGQHASAGRGDVFDGLHADGRHVVAHVLLRLGHLDHAEPAGPAQERPRGGCTRRCPRRPRSPSRPGLSPPRSGRRPAGPSPWPASSRSECPSTAGRRSAAGQLALAHQKLGGVVGRPAETHALAGELLHDRPQERVVLVVFLVREEVRKEHADGPQVGRVPHDHPRLEEQHLVDLARHDHVGHGMPLEVADGGAEAAQPAPLKVPADLGQLGIGVTDNAQAEDFRSLPPQGLDDQQRIASPAGHQADAGRGAAEEVEEVDCCMACQARNPNIEIRNKCKIRISNVPNSGREP